MSVLIPVYSGRKITGHTIVDDEDAHQSAHRWRVIDGYAIRTSRADGRARTIRLHREILGLTHGDSLASDHINRNRLDNRRSNLRVVTRAQNAQNVPSHRGSSSKYRGVTWYARARKWLAQAKFNGRNHFLGYYRIEEDAAAAASEFRRANMAHAIESGARE
jgi:hypothetical protein